MPYYGPEFGALEAECQGCDAFAPVDDLGLCGECSAKLDRDMIRQRDWDYSATAFGVLPEKYEELRKETIRKYGAGFELIVPGTASTTAGHAQRTKNGGQWDDEGR